MSNMTALALLVIMSGPPAPSRTDAPIGSTVAPATPGNADPGTQRRAPDCPVGTGKDIVVCAPRPDQGQRLPLRDERAEPGEVVHHPSEPASALRALNDKPQCQYNCGPSPARENWGRLFKILKGEDPDE